MAVETSNQNNVIQQPRMPNIREMVEKVARERGAAPPAAAGAPPTSAAPSPPATEPAKPTIDPELAVQLERTKAEAELARQKLSQLEADLARMRSEDERAQKDWQYALARYGYKPEDVLPGWIQGGEVKPSLQTAPDPQAEYAERLKKLESVITQAQSANDRAARMQQLKATIGDSPDYELIRALEGEGSFLDYLLSEEQRRGVPVGENELKSLLAQREAKTREIAKPQVERIAKSAWGKALLKELLADAAKQIEQPAEPREPELGEHGAPVLGQDKPRITLGRDMNRTIEDAKRRALEAMQRRAG